MYTDETKQSTRNLWIVFALMLALFLSKNILFHIFCFYNWEPDGAGFWAQLSMLLPKISSALVLAGLVFLVKDKRWMIIPAILADVWCIANWIYMRNNNFLLDSFAFNIAGNLNGYWWSVLVFIQWALDAGMIISSIFYCLLVDQLATSRRRQAAMYPILLVLSVVLLYAGEGCYILSREADERPSFCWDIATREGRERVYGIDYEGLVAQTSLLTMPIYLLPDHIEIKQGKQYDRALTEADQQTLRGLEQTPDEDAPAADKLIIVICESLENWVVREDIMPHLSALTHADHVLYADNVQTQVIGAPSADGQLIINTGVLPLTEGYVPFRYPHNAYPGIMHNAADSVVMILPHDTTVWNQTAMSVAYGYDTTIVYSDVDTELFEKLNKVQQSGIQHIQCITQSTHAPFVCCEQSELLMPDGMPFFMSRFMRAFNVLDEGLGRFVDRIQTDSILRTYTIVITGDHHILYPAIRQQYQAYCQDNGLDYNPISPALPLIIYSPHIEGNIHLSDHAYQMDIYPTILHLIGADKRAQWQGFGINLLDKDAERRISADEAARLSDLAIRNNWFEQK